MREDIVQALRTRVYRAVAGSAWVYFSRNRASSFLQVLTAKVDGVAAAAYYLIDLVVTIAISLAYVAMALRVSASMTLLVMGCGALLALAVRGRLTRARQAGYEVLHGVERAPCRHQRLPREHEDRQGVRRRGASRRGVQPPLAHGRRASDASPPRRPRDTRLWLNIGSAALLAVIVYVAHAVVGHAAGVALPADVSLRASGAARHEPLRQAAVVRGRAAGLRGRCRGGGQGAGRGRAPGGSAPRDLARRQHRSAST